MLPSLSVQVFGVRLPVRATLSPSPSASNAAWALSEKASTLMNMLSPSPVAARTLATTKGLPVLLVRSVGLP